MSLNDDINIGKEQPNRRAAMVRNGPVAFVVSIPTCAPVNVVNLIITLTYLPPPALSISSLLSVGYGVLFRMNSEQC